LRYPRRAGSNVVWLVFLMKIQCVLGHRLAQSFLAHTEKSQSQINYAGEKGLELVIYQNRTGARTKSSTDVASARPGADS
jgi:hypothetical protein